MITHSQLLATYPSVPQLHFCPTLLCNPGPCDCSRTYTWTGSPCPAHRCCAAWVASETWVTARAQFDRGLLPTHLLRVAQTQAQRRVQPRFATESPPVFQFARGGKQCAHARACVRVCAIQTYSYDSYFRSPGWHVLVTMANLGAALKLPPCPYTRFTDSAVGGVTTRATIVATTNVAANTHATLRGSAQGGMFGNRGAVKPRCTSLACQWHVHAHVTSSHHITSMAHR